MRWPWVIGASLGALVVAGAAVAVAVASSGSSSSGRSKSANPTATTASPAKAQAEQAATRAQLAAQLAAAVSFDPAPAATGVSPDAPITVQTARGQLAAVTLTSSAGAAVPGTSTADGMTWQSVGHLAAATSYQISGSVTGADGVSVPFHSSFTTLTAAVTVHNTLYPLDGQVVGVGQPIVVKFSRSILSPLSQAAVLSHFTVTESTPVAGGWRWFSPTELHFRPEVYWPTGEQITVSSDLDGWSAGTGMWGGGQVSVHFSIGASHVAVANLATHTMVVTNNGVTIATYPISGGSSIYPTMNGTHIALDKETVVHMVSSTVGIPVHSPAGYDEYVYSDVHISDSGEYVHAAPWSVGSQGRANVSHGCINLSPANAQAFFEFSQVGDVIVVTGGPRPPAAGDHGVMDWSTDWSQYTPATVTPAVPPTTAAATTTTTTAPANTVGPATTVAVKPAG